MAKKKAESIELELKLRSEAAIKKLQQDLTKSVAHVEVGLDLQKSSVGELIKKLQANIGTNLTNSVQKSTADY